MTRRVIYSRGFPYGAPLVMLRGGATKDERVVDFMRGNGFTYDDSKHAWTHYMNAPELSEILEILSEEYDCEILAKKTMDANYILPHFTEVQP